MHSYSSNEIHAESVYRFKQKLMKGIKGLKKWRETSCSWIERFSITRMPLLSSPIYRFNALAVRISSKLCCGYWRADSQMNMEKQRTWNCQKSSEKAQNWRTPSTQFQELLQRYSSQDGVVLAKGETQSQRNRTGGPGTDPHRYSRLMFDEGAKSV